MTWTNIPDSDVGVGSKIKTSMMKALSDNISAFANADSGAPQVQNDAFADKDLGKVILLPYGNYTSGSYTLPNSYVWNDFREIIATGGVSITYNGLMSGVMTRDYFIDFAPTNFSLYAGWHTVIIPPGVQVARSSRISYLSPSSFTVTTTTDSYISQVIGFLN